MYKSLEYQIINKLNFVLVFWQFAPPAEGIVNSIARVNRQNYQGSLQIPTREMLISI
jgi:hypothetical protein